MDGSYLEMFKARLYGALGKLVQWKVSLPRAAGFSPPGKDLMGVHHDGDERVVFLWVRIRERASRADITVGVY